MPLLCPKIRRFKEKGKPMPPDQSLWGIFLGATAAPPAMALLPYKS